MSDFFGMLTKLRSNPFRPPEIIKLQEEIDAATRLATFHLSLGMLQESEIMKIVEMKLQKDQLYGDWVKGEAERRGIECQSFLR